MEFENSYCLIAICMCYKISTKINLKLFLNNALKIKSIDFIIVQDLAFIRFDAAIKLLCRKLIAMSAKYFSSVSTNKTHVK